MKHDTIRLAALAGVAFLAVQPASAQGFFGNLNSGFQTLTKDLGGPWQGPYVGAGVSLDKTAMEFPGQNNQATVDSSGTAGVEFIFFPTFDRSSRGDSMNLFAGYRVQKGNLVLGLEGDLVNGGKVAFTIPENKVCQNPNSGFSSVVCFELAAAGSLETKGHLSGVVGYSMTNNALAYATLGAAFGKNGVLSVAEQRSTSSGGGSSSSLVDNSGDEIGLSLGAGLETRISRHVSLRVSYSRDEFKDLSTRSQAFNFVPSGGGSGTSGTVTTANSYNIGEEQTFTTEAVKIAALYQF